MFCVETLIFCRERKTRGFKSLFSLVFFVSYLHFQQLLFLPFYRVKRDENTKKCQKIIG